MAPICTLSADPAFADDPSLSADEIIDLTDRRRVLLHVLLGVDVDPVFADAVFDDDRSG